MSDNPHTEIIPIEPTAVVSVGQVANHHAARAAFADYHSRRAANTLRRQANDLALFAQYLGAVNIQTSGEALQSTPDAWEPVTWGLVEGFVKWQLKQGYAVGSVNVRLATIKAYVRLAAKSGAISVQEHALIKTVTGYSKKEAKRVDQQRDTTRVGEKKGEHVPLSNEQVHNLKNSLPNTSQGRRDRVIMTLLLDHGLRVGELALLEVGHFDLTAGTLTFYRPKVDKVQTHNLTADAKKAVKAWLQNDAPAIGPLLRGSRKGGELTSAGMSVRGITGRVRYLGELWGIEGLSAHDCRHSWATRAARNGTDPFALQEAGGWSSLDMPRRYVEAAQIANENVKL